jgi:hypothetical protein
MFFSFGLSGFNSKAESPHFIPKRQIAELLTTEKARIPTRKVESCVKSLGERESELIL